MRIIGQKLLRDKLAVINNKVNILVGARGSGKTAIAKWLAHSLGETLYTEEEGKIDRIREIIEHSNTTPTRTIYYFKDADKMTVQAQNALLKLAEEPPVNAKLLIGVTNISSLLDTIESRAMVFRMGSYTTSELKEIYPDAPQWIIDTAENPGDIERKLEDEEQLKQLDEIAGKVVKMIGQATLQNVMTISNSIPKGYELDFTESLLRQFSINKQEVHATKYFRNSVLKVVQFRTQMIRTNANKKNCIDMLLIEMWKEYRKWTLPH